MSILNDIKGLFLPPVCPVCGGELHEGEGAFCMMCRTLAPQTGFWRRADNPLAERLRNEFPIVQASAFLWFVAGSPWQRAIHGFKYYNRWRTARDLGAWYGGNLADSGLYGSVDCIVPVPLHTRRLLARGYNQAAYIAEGIASRMGVRWRIGRSGACATTRARRPVLRPGAGRTCATCLRSRGPERWPDGTCCWSMTW